MLLFQVATLAYMIPWGMSTAACALVGNSIGENNIPLTKQYVKYNIGVGAFVNALVSITFIVLRYQIT